MSVLSRAAMRFRAVSVPQATMFAVGFLLLVDLCFFHEQEHSIGKTSPTNLDAVDAPSEPSEEDSMSSLVAMIPNDNPLRNCLEVSVSEQVAEGRAKVGTSMSLAVERVNPEACPFRINQDTFDVSLTGAVILLAEGVCDDTGTRCDFSVALADPGRYELSVRVAELVWDGPFDINDTCFQRDEHRLYVIGGPDRPGLKFVVSSGTVRQVCNPEEFYTGRWVHRPTAHALGGFSEYHWAPTTECDWPAYWEEERLRQLVKGRWILIIGDSSLEEIGYHLIMAIFKEYRDEFNVAANRRNAWQAVPDSRFFDTGFSEDGTRVSFLWCGHPTPDGNNFGSPTLLEPEFQENLKQLLGEDRPDVLLFNSGLHDLGRSKAGDAAPDFYMEYERNLAQAMVFLNNMTALRVWKNSSPKATFMECAKWAEGTRASVRRMNRLATRVAREHGYLVADQEDLNEGLHWMLESHHCRNMPPCHVFTLSLYNFFDYWWHSAVDSHAAT